jgi:hypothetical protein
MPTQTKVKTTPKADLVNESADSVPGFTEACKIGKAQLDRGEYVEIPRERIKRRIA